MLPQLLKLRVHQMSRIMTILLAENHLFVRAVLESAKSSQKFCQSKNYQKWPDVGNTGARASIWHFAN